MSHYTKRLLIIFAPLLALTGWAQSGKVTAMKLPEGNFMQVFYVAPNGNDANSGAADAPFATLERARDAVRSIRVPLTGDILVAVAPGDYFLGQPFVLTTEDSGSDGFKIRYQGLGEPGSARLIGGKRLSGWEPADGGIFRVKIDSDHGFNALYENGLRARKARFPNYEFDARFPLSGARYLNAKNGSDTVLTWRDGDLDAADVAALGNSANLVVWPWGYAAWHKMTRRIASVDAAGRTITVPEHKTGPAIGKNARYYIEGVRRFLDQPGEFYLDRAEGVLYYWPRFGNPNGQEIIAPLLKRIVSLEGTGVDTPVHDVIIDGFELAYTDTFDAMTGTTLFPWSITSSGAHGTLHLRYTEDIAVRSNHIKGSGMNAIYLDRSNKRGTICGNWIEDCGISGVVLAYHRERKQFPDDLNVGNVIENNLIHGLGSIAVDSAGVNIWGGKSNTVTRCEIFDGARYAVTIRGPFVQGSYADTGRPFTSDNIIRNSFFHRMGQDSGDMGAVHMAAISTPDFRPVNTLEQLLITDIAAHPSMNDVKPNGIFFDYPDGVSDQVLRNIEIRSTAVPFRTNRTDVRHIYDNCSWRAGFDSSRMDYENIGLRKDFPANFRAPGEVTDVAVKEAGSADQRILELSWKNPADADLKAVRITAEGLTGYAEHVVPAGKTTVRIPRPASDRLVMFRVQAEDACGNRSSGILIPAAERPQPVENLTAKGIEGGNELSWNAEEQTIGGFRIVTRDPAVAPVTVKAGARQAQLSGLENGKSYLIRVDVLDRDGHAWPGPEIRASAGGGVPVPEDAAVWWTFDEPAIRAGLSIGDASGNGNTLFVGNDKVQLADGKFGKALRFDGETAFARVLAPDPLAIGTGDYAISVWIRQASTENFTQRFLDFGGGGTSKPGICLMANNQDVRLIFSDSTAQYSPFYRGLSMVGNWMHVVVNIDRDKELVLYVNGEKLVAEDISKSAGVNIPPAAEFLLGRYASNNNPKYNWPGDLDQLRIYKRALTLPEIAALYQETSSE